MVAPKNYTVDRKDEIRQLSKGGEVVTVYRIFATSAGGTYFHVDVPEVDLKNAEALLAAKAQTLDSIK
jgi:hypothetical protein